MSKAFGKSNPDQEVVVMSIRRGKHWGIFDRDYLTSLLAYLKDDLLYVQISRADWEVPNNLKTQIPEPHEGEEVMKFRLLPSEGMTLASAQSVAVSWRDPIFRRPTRAHPARRKGRAARDPDGDARGHLASRSAARDGRAPAVSPERAQARDLEEQKTRGEVTQTEYTVMHDHPASGSIQPQRERPPGSGDPAR
jgi:hypothetical protein